MPRVLRRGMATLPDVAKKAGVSTATAARALGGYGSVREATRERVTAAAADLGYRANGLARSMITGSPQTLGVVLADIENPFFYTALRGITDTARSKGYDVLLINTDEDLEAERKALSVLAERRVDGLILCAAESEDREHVAGIIDSGIPIVLLDRQVRGLAADWVGIDNRRAAADATRVLLRLGHKRIAIVTGGRPAIGPFLQRPGMRGVERIPGTTLGTRAAGYRDALLEAGLEPRAEYLSAEGFRREDAVTATRRLMTLTEPPTALLTFDSVLTLGALQALRELALRCPQDISLLGFDDAEWAEVVSPPLTVVRQPVYEIGTSACELLLARVEGDDHRPAQRRLKTELVERGSTAPAPG